MSDFEDDPSPVLLPCTICSRTFRPEVLERHVKVCEKTASKKRRVFDSFKSRVSGTELEEFLGPAPLPGQAPRRPFKSPVKKRAPSKWKETHESLIATLRAARGVEPSPDTVMEAPKPTGNEQCPSCSRYFGPRAFDRHVEFCKEKTARIKLTPSKVSQAQERLEARTKYRAPLSIKPKLTTKEKYSPMLTRKDSSESCSVTTSSTKTSPPIPTVSRNLKVVKQNLSGFSRQSPIRSSERQRSVSPSKKNVVSSSKSNNLKSESQSKTSNHPKIKENLKSPEDLRPKTGSKTSTQEKIRISNLKQLEDETYKQLKKLKKKTRHKISPNKTSLQSDNDSSSVVENDLNDNQYKTYKKFQSKKERLVEKKKTTEDIEKIILDLTNVDKIHSKGKEKMKSARRNKQIKPQVNDLSVNDESFGIFVAACTMRPPSSSASKTSIKTMKDSPKKKKTVPSKIEESNTGHRSVKKKPDHNIENKPPEEILKVGRSEKIEKVSKIPKPKADFPKKMDKTDIKEVETNKADLNYEVEGLNEIVVEENNSRSEKIKNKSKKWRNITEISTQELAQLSEDIDVQPNQELTESDIWEIAGKQFLQDEPNHSTSAFSVDSLNENPETSSQNCHPQEDDLIVLHLTDPAKLVENDADMKLSVSEPCFPNFSAAPKHKKKSPESKIVDIIIFTAFPGRVQPKIIHRNRKKQKKVKKSICPESSHIREKTFLANEIPKPKRRKTCLYSCSTNAVDISEFKLPKTSKEKLEKIKKKFVDNLKSRKEKIPKWQVGSNFHIRFMEEFEKSLENDLRELKNLFKGKKTKRRPSLKAFKLEKFKKMNEEVKTNEKKPKSTKFEYFEISLNDECCNDRENVQTQVAKNDKNDELISKPCTTPETPENPDKSRNYCCFEIANATPTNNSKLNTNQTKVKKVPIVNEEQDEELGGRLKMSSESKQVLARQSNSLENIEEVDETATETEKDIEIEDFILSRPNTRKLLSKEENCLDELFPKPRKVAEVLTSVTSTTAVKLGFTTDSVYDLKFSEEKTMVLPQITTTRGNSGRILKSRARKESQLPQIAAKSKEQKENSMLTLIDVWKNKKEKLKKEKLCKGKTVLPTIRGKLPPLTDQNSYQIAALPGVLKKTLSEMVIQRLFDAPESNDSYDPFKQAERQMLALLSWPSTADIKTAKNFSPSSKSKTSSQQNSNLQTSPTSAFTKYPNKDDKSKKDKMNVRKSLNETFAVNDTTKKNKINEKPTYAGADDWEQIFEKHFDLNRNEMTEQSVKSALDGLLKNAKNKANSEGDFSPSKNDITQNSIITEVLYTSTPKKNSDKVTKSADSTVDLDQTPNTYRKSSNFLPEDFNDALGKSKKNDKANRNSGISLSSLSFCSQISDTTLADEEVMRSNLEIIGKAAAAAAARSPRRKYARSQSVFDERNKMLFAQTYDPNCTSSDEEILPKSVGKSPSRNPKSSPSHFYRSQSVTDGKCKGDGNHSEEGDQTSSPESNKHRKAKFSGDSAYSSLNRRSPRQNTQRNLQDERLSSSGSEHSLSAVTDYDSKSKSSDVNNVQSPKKELPVKMSKFCHECGSKYPVALAKFCCECGVRRLII